MACIILNFQEITEADTGSSHPLQALLSSKTQKNQSIFEKELSDVLYLWYRFARMVFRE
jgi:hypothetical protein